MKKFLIVWSVLTVILTIAVISSSFADVNNRRSRYLDISSIKIPQWVETMKKYNNWDDWPEFSTANNVTKPAVEFFVLFWSIPVALASLITIALRKKE